MKYLKFLFFAVFRMIWPRYKSPAIGMTDKDPSLIKDVWKAMLKNKSVIFALAYLSIFFLVGVYTAFVGLTNDLPHNETLVIILSAFLGLGLLAIIKMPQKSIKNKITIGVMALSMFFSAIWLMNILGVPLTPYGYEQIDYGAVRQGPSLAHWFGTDLIGRDVFTRVIFSMGTTIELAILIVFFGGLVIGVALGLIAGYFGGKIDSLIMRVGELFAIMPPFFMFLYLTMTLRPRYENFFYSLGGTGEWLIKEGIVDFSMIFLVFSIFFWIGSARIIRSETLRLREMPYIDASRILGASPSRIILRHILPNLLGIITLWVFEALGSAAMAEIGVSWFGLGIRPPHPSFGVMFSEISSVRLLATYPHLLIFPGLVVSLFVFCFAFLQMKLDIILNTLYTKGGGK